MAMARRNVEKAVQDVVEAYKKSLDEGKIEGGSLSPYGPSQRSRRRKRGLQTFKKDLQYSSTLVKSIKEVDRVQGDDFFQITIGFTGRAHRRDDQRDSFDNDTLATYLSRQQRGGKPLLRLEKQVKERIEKKWGVTITSSDDRI